MRKLFFLLGFLGILANPLFAQTPIVLSAGADTAICLGTQAFLQASITDTIIRETNTYSITAIPFGNYPLNNGTLCANPFIDDNYYGPFQIGFNFCFYGQTYTQFWVGSNGWVSFQPLSGATYDPWTLTTYGGLPNSDPSRPRAAIMACYRDWHPGVSGQIRYNLVGTSPNRKAIITFNGVALFSCTSVTGTFQVVLHEWTNYVDIHMVNVPTCPTWNGGLGVQGIQNAAGTVGLAYPGRNNTTWTQSNQSIRFTPTGNIIPLAYQWFVGASATPFATTSAVTVSPAVTTNYTVKATVCNNTVTDVIEVESEPCGYLTTSSTISNCYGGSTGTATVVIHDGIAPYTYIWSNGMGTPGVNDTVNTVTNLSAGTYGVTVSTLGGAYVLETTVVVGQNPQLTTSATTLPETCPGASDGLVSISCAQTLPQGPFTYFCSTQPNSLPTNNQFYNFEGLATGTYSLTVADVFGCTATTSATVNQLSLSFTTNSSVISCHGDTNAYAAINVSGGTPPYVYNWSTGATTQGITNLGAGTYSVIVSDANNCQIGTSVTFVEPDPIAMYSSGDQSICLSNSANIVTAVVGGTPPYNYFWNPGGYASGNITISPTTSTQYCVYVRDANNCLSNSRCISVEVHPPLTIEASLAPDSICQRESTFINATMSGGNGGPYFYELFNGPIINLPYEVAPNESRKYIIIGRDGCGTPTVTDTVEVNVLPIPPINVRIDKDKGCPPHSVHFEEISPNLNQTYEWNFGDASYFEISYDKAPFHDYLNPGVYDVNLTVFNELGCSRDTLFTNMIRVFDKPTAGFTADPEIAYTEFPVVQFDNISLDGNYYFWTFGTGDSLMVENPLPYTFPGEGIYVVSLVAENSQGCRDTVFRNISVVERDNVFYMPNAFSPNSGVPENRIFMPVGNLNAVKNYSLLVFNRWGEQIFESTKPEKGWNGTAGGGKIVPSGVYTWILRYEDPNGKIIQRNGNVNLLN